ncbi:MAG: class I SAM-dependent methyltransferase, partial [Candidatus Calescibacterium sp.]|nr:class I SAM-dependent methyltransferase [Candidatus Calescibacterium sp.]
MKFLAYYHKNGKFMTLQCPQCSQVIILSADIAICTTCNQKWPVEYGIPIICRKHYQTYFADELNPELSKTLILKAESEGWQNGLKNVLRFLPKGNAEYLSKYICGQQRTLALYLLDVSPNHIILDHGCGWGNITCYLASQVKTVVAMDLVTYRSRFTQIRGLQSGLNNIIPVISGDYPKLPFLDNSFDSVIMNGVLEWIPYNVEGDPYLIQAKRLEEIARLLKPGGQLLLAIENRYWWRYFLGNPEVHTGIPYISIIPRCLANIWARLLGYNSFRAYTYSLWGYKHLLRRCKFKEIQCFLVFPEYNFPEIIIPISQSMILPECKRDFKKNL